MGVVIAFCWSGAKARFFRPGGKLGRALVARSRMAAYQYRNRRGTRSPVLPYICRGLSFFWLKAGRNRSMPSPPFHLKYFPGQLQIGSGPFFLDYLEGPCLATFQLFYAGASS